MPSAAAQSLIAPQLDWSSVAAPATELGLEPFIEAHYYESRLSRDQAQVDYLLALPRSAAAAAKDRIQTHTADGSIDGSRWGAISDLLELWGDGASLTSVGVPTVWFEHDDILNSPLGRAPSVSVCITPAYRISESLPASSPTDLTLTREVLKCLGAEMDKEQHQSLSVVFRELPLGARWIHVSYMLGREPRAVKLYGVLNRAELMPYLQRVGWAGDRAAIEHAIQNLYPSEQLGDELYLDLNLDNFRDRQRCSLGLAVAQQHVARGPDRDPSRAAILKAWTLAGLCDATKVDSAQAWPASESTSSASRRETRFLDIKLVWQAQSGFAAKAYVGLLRSRRWF